MWMLYYGGTEDVQSKCTTHCNESTGEKPRLLPARIWYVCRSRNVITIQRTTEELFMYAKEKREAPDLRALKRHFPPDTAMTSPHTSLLQLRVILWPRGYECEVWGQQRVLWWGTYSQNNASDLPQGKPNVLYTGLSRQVSSPRGA